MRTIKDNKVATAAGAPNSSAKIAGDQNDYSNESGAPSLTGILGKRGSNETSAEKLRLETEDSHNAPHHHNPSNNDDIDSEDGEDMTGDDPDKKERR